MGNGTCLLRYRKNKILAKWEITFFVFQLRQHVDQAVVRQAM